MNFVPPKETITPAEVRFEDDRFPSVHTWNEIPEPAKEDRKNARYEAFLAAPPVLGDDPLAASREPATLPAQESLPLKRDRAALRQSARAAGLGRFALFGKKAK